MAGDKLVVICRSGGEFVKNNDGSMLYTGIEARAVDVDYDTLFDDFKAEVALTWEYDVSTISIKYFLPTNQRALITMIGDRDLKRIIDFYKELATADVYVFTLNTTVVTPSIVPAICSNSAPVLDSVAHTSVADALVESSGTPKMMATPFDNSELPKLTTTTENSGLPKLTAPIEDSVLPRTITAIDDSGIPKMTTYWKTILTEVGQEFGSIAEFRDTLRKYAIAHCFVYKYVKNEKYRITAKCKVKDCPWRIHASKAPGGIRLQVKTWNKSHTCGGGIGMLGHPQASKRLVASIVKDRLRETPHCKPRDLVNDIRREYGIELTYKQAWRGKEMAIEEIHGSHIDAFKTLPKYCQRIMDANPGSVAVFTTSGDQRFLQFFISFHASRYGFEHGCRPLIFLDSIALRSKYKGMLLGATAVDGNNGVYPIAFAIVDRETDDNWQWFLRQLKSVVTTSRAITFLSDRHRSLKESVPVVFENSHHAYCMRHLAENMKKELSSLLSKRQKDDLVYLLNGASKACTIDEFTKLVSKMREISDEAFKWVMQQEPEHWSDALFTGHRYRIYTTNIAECFGPWIEEAQELPIVLLVETLQRKMMETLYTRLVDSGQWQTQLTPKMESRLEEEVAKSRVLRTLVLSRHEYEVHDSAVYGVDVQRWECTCRMWQLTGLPCSHAVAVFDRTNRRTYDYCSRYLTSECYREMYSVPIHPIPSIGGVLQTESIEGPVIYPPQTRVAPGRTKKKRMELQEICKRPIKCSRCSQIGHNRATCRACI